MMPDLRSEEGFTLVELMFTVAMMVVVVVVFLTVFTSLNEGLATQRDRSRANDEARQAIEHLDREIRSGNVIYDPADESVPYYTFRIFSQANATTRSSTYTDADGFGCVQWQINDDEELVRRFWKPSDPTVATDWQVFAENIVNRVPGIEEPAFQLDPDPIRSSRTIVVTLMVDPDTTETISRPVRIQTSLTGRNTTIGYSEALCDPAPA